jgi:hypothetical protein
MMIRTTPLFAPSPNSKQAYQATDLYLPTSAWVGRGEGCAYRWWRGDYCRLIGGDIFKMDICPIEMIEQFDHDEIILTNQRIGQGSTVIWAKVDEDDELPFVEAYTNRVQSYCERLGIEAPEDGVYVLVGEEEGFVRPSLVPRLSTVYLDAPRDYLGIREYLKERELVGLLWAAVDRPEVSVFASDFPEDPAAGVSDGSPA